MLTCCITLQSLCVLLKVRADQHRSSEMPDSSSSRNDCASHLSSAWAPAAHSVMRVHQCHVHVGSFLSMLHSHKV